MQKIRVEKERVHMKLKKMGNDVLINILIWIIFQGIMYIKEIFTQSFFG